MKKVCNIMSNLREQFTADLKTAMKAGEKGKVSTIRLVQAALKDKDIEARGAGKGEATPDEILALLQKMIKQRQESIAIYDANSRPELADGERAEVAVISAYLPAQMSDEEIKAAIEEVIAETGAASVKDMGKVIGALRGAYAGQMDFAKVSPMVKQLLGG
ncbi:glutamyl-tRNA amidotransferase [Bosea sp. Tri-44]|nr:glutamyl-tRNA amidotransferase [Bosea sp. Tri-44]